jgi:hypothetical protein
VVTGLTMLRNLGRVQHPKFEAGYRHPWLHARLFRGINTVLRDGVGYSRQDFESPG